MSANSKPSRPASEAQIAANRRNAKRSTGPRTPHGKERSSGNALKHGAYARRLAAVGSGPFAEDPDEIAALVRALVDGLAPRDELERARAECIAQIHLRERRLDAYECALLEAERVEAELQREAHADRVQDDVVDHIYDWNEDRGSAATNPTREPSEQPPWEAMAVFVRRVYAPKLKVKDLWNDEREPSSAEEWRRAFGAIARHCFPTVDSLRVALCELRVRRDELERERHDGARREVAMSSLGTLRACQAERARLTSDLAKQLLVYGYLQERRLTHNE